MQAGALVHCQKPTEEVWCRAVYRARGHVGAT